MAYSVSSISSLCKKRKINKEQIKQLENKYMVDLNQMYNYIKCK